VAKYEAHSSFVPIWRNYRLVGCEYNTKSPPLQPLRAYRQGDQVKALTLGLRFRAAWLALALL
jgi:hypothetical protein